MLDRVASPLQAKPDPAGPKQRVCPVCLRSPPAWRVGEACSAACERASARLDSLGLRNDYQARLRASALARRPAGAITSGPTAESAEASSPDWEAFDLETDAPSQVKLALSGLHCSACIWLLEALPNRVPGLADLRVDWGHGEARLRLDPGARLAPIAQIIDELGFAPRWAREEATSETRAPEARSELAIAGFCAANLMLFALPHYTGAGPEWTIGFGWASAALAAVAIALGSRSMHRRAWASWRSGSIGIDSPLLLAIWGAFALSVWRLLRGEPAVYFDSLGALIFLMAGSRFMLDRMVERARRLSRGTDALLPERSGRWNEGKQAFEPVPTRTLEPGDRIRVASGERIPADGRVDAGSEALLDQSVLSGEAEPVRHREGGLVPAGALNVGEPIVLTLIARPAESAVGRLSLQGEELFPNAKPRLLRWSERVARAYPPVVLAAALLAGYFGVEASGADEGLRRALSVLLITCPCAFALMIPLAYAFAQARAARIGAWIRSSEAWERLSRARIVVFDKTGTLTRGQPTLQLVQSGMALPSLARAVVALEQNARHPLGRALLAAYSGSVSGATPPAEDWREIPGLGVEGKIGGRAFRIHSDPRAARLLALEISDGQGWQALARWRWTDELRPEAREAVARLRSGGLRVGMLTGDRAQAAESAALATGFAPGEVVAEAGPESKHDFASRHEGCVFVGDGLNDAPALRAASVGIAVGGAFAPSVDAASVYLPNGDLRAVARLLSLARRSESAVRQVLAISIVFNLLGATLAATGRLEPLFAAVGMPLTAALGFFWIALRIGGPR